MASNDAEVTEVELEHEFRKNPRSGMECLELFFRRNIFAYIKSLCPSFGVEELLDVYQDTMRRMVKAACREGFDPSNPMRLVQHIAEKAAIDAKRKKKIPPVGDSRDVAERIGDDMAGTKVAMEWRLILEQDMPKVRRAIDDAISGLPPKQKIAAEAMMRVFEDVYDTDSFLPLRVMIRDMTGEDLTTTQAYDNWRNARKTIAARLKRAGFDLLREE